MADKLIGNGLWSHTAEGTGAISDTLTPGQSGELIEVRLHLSDVGGAGTFTVTLDSESGSAFDVELQSQDMTSVSDLFWQPTRPSKLSSGDKILSAWPNANGRTYGLELIWREVG